jgi:hypothetical protein
VQIIGFGLQGGTKPICFACPSFHDSSREEESSVRHLSTASILPQERRSQRLRGCENPFPPKGGVPLLRTLYSSVPLRSLRFRAPFEMSSLRSNQWREATDFSVSGSARPDMEWMDSHSSDITQHVHKFRIFPFAFSSLSEHFVSRMATGPPTPSAKQDKEEVSLLLHHIAQFKSPLKKVKFNPSACRVARHRIGPE